ADVEHFALAVLEFFASGKAAIGQPTEEVDFAGPGAGEDVHAAIAVEVHQLWSEADASAHGHPTDLAARLEPGVAGERRLIASAGVLVDAQPAFVVLTDQQGGHTGAVDVADEGGRVAITLHVERFTADLNLNGWKQIAEVRREVGPSQDSGQSQV